MLVCLSSNYDLRKTYLPLIAEALEGGGGPSIPYPFKYFEKNPKSLKEIWQLSPKIRKHCIPISLKVMESIPKIT